MLTPEQKEQGSAEWLALRRTKITGTDAPIIMLENPWTTPMELWRRKLGLDPEPFVNQDMLRGKELEPLARAWYEKNSGIRMSPDVVLNPEYPFMMASLDGISVDGGRILEIKCPNDKTYNHIQRGGHPPRYYRSQIQHCMACTQAVCCDFMCYRIDDGVESAFIYRVERHQPTIEYMIDREEWFYKHLINMTEPIEEYE